MPLLNNPSATRPLDVSALAASFALHLHRVARPRNVSCASSPKYSRTASSTGGSSASTASSAVTHPEHAGKCGHARADGTHHARRARGRGRGRGGRHTARRDDIENQPSGRRRRRARRHVRHRVRVAVRGRRRVVSNARARRAMDSSRASLDRRRRRLAARVSPIAR